MPTAVTPPPHVTTPPGTAGFRPWRTWRRGLLAAFWLAAASPTIYAQNTEPPQEYLVKAAILYNFGQFIEWPAAAFSQAQAPFSICVMGKDPFGKSILSLQKRSYKTRPIVIGYPKTVAEARNCHILYVDNPRNTPLGRDVGNALGDAPVLTVSTDEDAMESGIGIGFVNQDGKTRWTMNLVAVRRAQLKVSAKLVEIAVAVVGDIGR